MIQVPIAEVLQPRSPLAVARDVVALTKPRLAALVLCTTAGGNWLAPGHRDGVSAAVLLVGTALVVGAANALNDLLERDVDALMRRTRDRPLPAGRLDPAVALTLGLSMYLKEDYARGGAPGVRPRPRRPRRFAAATSLLLIPVSLTLLPLGLAGPVYGVAAALLGGALAGYGLIGLRQRGAAHRWARNFFLLTLVYLTLLFAALLVSGR